MRDDDVPPSKGAFAWLKFDMTVSVPLLITVLSCVVALTRWGGAIETQQRVNIQRLDGHEQKLMEVKEEMTRTKSETRDELRRMNDKFDELLRELRSQNGR